MRLKVFTILLISIVVLCGCRRTHKRSNSESRNTQDKAIINSPTENNLSNDNSISNVEQYMVDACDYLNAIRQTPSAYSSALGVDLKSVEPRHPLKLNQKLIKAAIKKAQDMADRNYFAHIDPNGNGMNIMIKAAGYDIPAEWYEVPSENYFESLGAGVSSSKDIIDLLIIDANTPTLGHRKHLLGIDEFNSNCEDIGIGHAYNPSSQYKHYWCILIAKHSY